METEASVPGPEEMLKICGVTGRSVTAGVVLPRETKALKAMTRRPERGDKILFISYKVRKMR
jgi:hypothetical protein